MKYHLSGSHVAHETIDGESIIIDLDRGIYFSLDGAGAVIWQGLAGGTAVDDIVADLTAEYDASPAEIDLATRTLLEQLTAETIIVASPPNGAGPRPEGPRVAPESRKAFLRPVLRKFTDMQDLLLLDPIHEVDETGWPQTRAD